VRVWRANELDQEINMACGRWNSGWMSVLENKAKRFLGPMMLGLTIQLDLEAQLLLATWAMQTTMVHEFLSKELPHHTSGERIRIMDTLTPPDDVMMWISEYRGSWKTHGVAHHLRLVRSDNVLSPAHVATFAFGKLALQVLSYREGRG